MREEAHSHAVVARRRRLDPGSRSGLAAAGRRGSGSGGHASLTRGSAPTAPRWSRLTRISRPQATTSWDFLPLILATDPTPPGSCSREGSYRPCGGGIPGKIFPRRASNLPLRATDIQKRPLPAGMRPVDKTAPGGRPHSPPCAPAMSWAVLSRRASLAVAISSSIKPPRSREPPPARAWRISAARSTISLALARPVYCAAVCSRPPRRPRGGIGRRPAPGRRPRACGGAGRSP